MYNKYLKRSHISEYQFRHLLRCFCHDYTAKIATELTGISRPTINSIYGKFRERIFLLVDNAKLNGEVEVDESYFGARRVRENVVEVLKGKLRWLAF